ncbi:hypothetical protein [Alienimonas chondri]|uniref:Uncharacterized protein n=1 Tax=Alienimonas chondri TaxID=2681879 RepID=A0ABX1V9J5_9PLAN|nr:hypothetical protein [Alienimonas chondri]NNJ24719.1 hypothetical protein [Alienimonas chondri]
METWEGGDDAARDRAFFPRIAREYFRVVGGANRRYAPDHLVFGDRFAFITLEDVVVQEMLPWVDALAVQAAAPMGARNDLLSDRVAAVSALPGRAIWRQFLGGTQADRPAAYRLASPLTHLDTTDPSLHFLIGETHDPSAPADRFRDAAADTFLSNALRRHSRGPRSAAKTPSRRSFPRPKTPEERSP